MNADLEVLSAEFNSFGLSAELSDGSGLDIDLFGVASAISDLYDIELLSDSELEYLEVLRLTLPLFGPEVVLDDVIDFYSGTFDLEVDPADDVFIEIDLPNSPPFVSVDPDPGPIPIFLPDEDDISDSDLDDLLDDLFEDFDDGSTGVDQDDLTPDIDISGFFIADIFGEGEVLVKVEETGLDEIGFELSVSNADTGELLGFIVDDTGRIANRDLRVGIIRGFDDNFDDNTDLQDSLFDDTDFNNLDDLTNIGFTEEEEEEEELDDLFTEALDLAEDLYDDVVDLFSDSLVADFVDFLGDIKRDFQRGDFNRNGISGDQGDILIVAAGLTTIGVLTGGLGAAGAAATGSVNTQIASGLIGGIVGGAIGFSAGEVVTTGTSSLLGGILPDALSNVNNR